jgi:hypothetical protein
MANYWLDREIVDRVNDYFATNWTQIEIDDLLRLGYDSYKMVVNMVHYGVYDINYVEMNGYPRNPGEELQRRKDKGFYG